VEVVALVDVPFEAPWNIFFPRNKPSDFDPYRELYPATYGDGTFRTNAACYAIRSEGKTILCDTGLGPGPIEMLGGIEGKLLHDMNAKGVQPESVDIVVHTHLHVDHVGWNLSPENVPNFPAATYHAPEKDWEFFHQNLQANPQMQQVIPLHEQGRLELFKGEKALTSEVSTFPTPGHTPGHSSLLISSGGQQAIVAGDLAHHPAQIDQPGWSPGFDVDPNLSVQSRSAVFDRLEAEGLIGAFCHFPSPGFGRLARANGKRIFQAL
jgi:glyoxylase-like metal-dependent hydrolase (beta-lactamase superfamily II)